MSAAEAALIDESEQLILVGCHRCRDFRAVRANPHSVERFVHEEERGQKERQRQNVA